MRIDLHYGPQSTPESDRSGQQKNQVAGTTAEQVQLGQDQAMFSGAHIQVQALAAQASLLPEIREEKVQSLRQTVQSGQYHPDPEKIASALVAQMALDPVV